VELPLEAADGVHVGHARDRQQARLDVPFLEGTKLHELPQPLGACRGLDRVHGVMEYLA
jgi:hypothetical protein